MRTAVYLDVHLCVRHLLLFLLDFVSHTSRLVVSHHVRSIMNIMWLISYHILPGISFILMRRPSEASLFFLDFPRKIKPLHNCIFPRLPCRSTKRHVMLNLTSTGVCNTGTSALYVCNLLLWLTANNTTTTVLAVRYWSSPSVRCNSIYVWTSM